MNLRPTCIAAFVAALACASSVHAESQRELHAAAKIVESDARKMALKHAPPHSVVQSIELEREAGKLVWSYDLRAPASKEIFEVQIDAITGEVANMHGESLNHEAAEAAADQKNSH